MKLILHTKTYVIVMSIIIMAVFTGCQDDAGSKSTTPVKAEHKTTAQVQAHGPEFLGGHVEETMNSGGYTYMRLMIGKDNIWVAVPQMNIKVGDDIVLLPGNKMKNFHSKTLNRTFGTIIFSPGPVDGGGSHASMGSNPHTADKKAASHGKTVAPMDQEIKVEKAQGEDAFTIADIYQKADELNDKPVKVRGKIVKVARNIMGKNWIHIQDGTGSVDKYNFDLTVTTSASPQTGDVVTITGTLHKDKDFGFGYHYNVIVEDAALKK